MERKLFLRLKNIILQKDSGEQTESACKRGFSTPELKEALVKKRSMENCRECYILADDSKFNQISSVTFAPFESAKVITTGLTKPAYRKCKNVIEV